MAPRDQVRPAQAPESLESDTPIEFPRQPGDADTRDRYLGGIDRLARVFPGGPVALTRWVTAKMKKSIAEVGVPETPDFLGQIVASGDHLWACRMFADMNHLTKVDLYDEAEDIISAPTSSREPKGRNYCSSSTPSRPPTEPVRGVQGSFR